MGRGQIAFNVFVVARFARCRPSGSNVRIERQFGLARHWGTYPGYREFALEKMFHFLVAAGLARVANVDVLVARRANVPQRPAKRSSVIFKEI